MAKELKHTFGMAVWDDRDGAIFTIQSIMAMFPKLMPVSEFVIVCNDPDGRSSRVLEQDCKSFSKSGVDVRFVAMHSPIGACPPKQRIFEEARGKYTTVTDSHVVPQLNAYYALDRYYDANPETSDLLTGPLVYNDRTISTHWDDIWGGPMRGRWGEAWLRPDGSTCGVLKSSTGHTNYCELAIGSKPMDGPEVRWADRLVELPKHGYKKLGHTPGEAFEIGCMGEGLFSCRTKAWLGYHPQFRGFTGGAWYINEKYKRAGFRTLCLSDLKWWHRFVRTTPASYPNTYSDRCRNYAIGLRDLGLPLDDLRRAYTEGKKPLLTTEEFERIAADPISYPYSKPRAVVGVDGVGTELLKLAKENGIKEKPECPCRNTAAIFNAWGIDVCETRKEEIVTVLRKSAKAWDWIFKIDEAQQAVDEAALSTEVAEAIAPLEEDEVITPAVLGEKIKTGILAVVTGTIFKVDPVDPFPGMVDEAIRRAKAVAEKKAS